MSLWFAAVVLVEEAVAGYLFTYLCWLHSICLNLRKCSFCFLLLRKASEDKTRPSIQPLAQCSRRQTAGEKAAISSLLTFRGFFVVSWSNSYLNATRVCFQLNIHVKLGVLMQLRIKWNTFYSTCLIFWLKNAALPLFCSNKYRWCSCCRVGWYISLLWFFTACSQ